MERWERIRRLGPRGGVYVTPQYSFGVDALALAAFGAPRGDKQVAELGAGCGVISLLFCGNPRWRQHAPQITAVEIQPAAAALAARSVARNGLQDKIRVVTADWRQMEGILEAGAFDRVVCNPPYFPAGSGGVSGDEARRIARHEAGPEALGDLCAAAARLLKNGGSFCLCHRPERLTDLLTTLRGAGLEPKRLQLVQQEGGSVPFLVLIDARKGAKPGLQTETTLLLREGDEASPAARRIYGMW